jgi:hypothetical protein
MKQFFLLKKSELHMCAYRQNFNQCCAFGAAADKVVDEFPRHCLLCFQDPVGQQTEIKIHTEE